MKNEKKLINIDKVEEATLTYDVILGKYIVTIGLISGAIAYLKSDHKEAAEAEYEMIKSTIKNYIEIYED